MPPTKQQVKLLTRQVQVVLLHHWNPIGIDVELLPQDEYDSYAPKIAGMILAGADKVRVAAHLYQIEAVAMGVTGNRARCESVALRLLSLVQQRD